MLKKETNTNWRRMMYRVIRLPCFPLEYNWIVLPQVYRQQRHSSERWIGRRWLRSHSASNHIFVWFFPPSISNVPLLQLHWYSCPLFAHHHNFYSPFTFFLLSFLFFTLLLPHLDFLIFLFFAPSSTTIRWHNNKLIRAEMLLQSKLVKRQTKRFTSNATVHR